MVKTIFGGQYTLNLGSMTGGTLSDSTPILEFDDYVSGSTYDAGWCSASGPNSEM